MAEFRSVKGQDDLLAMSWLVFISSVHLISNLGCQLERLGRVTLVWPGGMSVGHFLHRVTNLLWMYHP